MLTIEKVLTLSRADIFAGLPGDSIAEIALLTEEVEVAAGNAVPSGSERSGAMYVVATGRIKFHVNNSATVECGPGEVFGELNALDPGNEAISATAMEDSLLLKIEHENLFDVISEDIEIAKTVIRHLCRRLCNEGTHLPPAEPCDGEK